MCTTSMCRWKNDPSCEWNTCGQGMPFFCLFCCEVVFSCTVLTQNGQRKRKVSLLLESVQEVSWHSFKILHITIVTEQQKQHYFFQNAASESVRHLLRMAEIPCLVPWTLMRPMTIIPAPGDRAKVGTLIPEKSLPFTFGILKFRWSRWLYRSYHCPVRWASALLLCW